MSELLFYAAVINTLLAAAVALLAMLATRAGLRPAWTHWLWLASLLRLIMPPLWSLSLLPPLSALATGDQITLTTATDTLSFLPSPTETPGNHPALPQTKTSGLASPPLAASPEVPPVRWTWPHVITFLWLGGTLGWWALASSRLARFQRYLRHVETVPFSFSRAADLPVRLVEAPISPCLWAWGRSCIVFPRELYLSLPPTERELILRHELAHYRRRDHWVRWIEFVVLGLHWWNPFAWWLARRLREAEETACDAEVTSGAPDERRTYATALLRTVDFLANRAQPMPFLASGVSVLPLLQRRVQKILATPVPPPRPAQAVGVGLLLATVLMATPVPVDPSETAPTSVPDHNETNPSSDPPSETAAPSPSPEKPDLVTSGKDSYPSAKTALEVAKAFFAADTVDEKLRYVRFGEKMRPRMEAWYQTHGLRPESLVDNELSLVLTKNLRVGDRHFIVITVQFESTSAFHFLAVEKTPEGPKIDWETCVGWQPMAFANFTKVPQSGPQLFRVHAAADDYYSRLFAEEAVWQCVKLTYPGQEDFLLYGYARRDSEAGRRLAALLDGQSVSIIVSLSRPEGAEASQAIIERVVHESWFLPDGPLSAP